MNCLQFLEHSRCLSDFLWFPCFCTLSLKTVVCKHTYCQNQWHEWGMIMNPEISSEIQSRKGGCMFLLLFTGVCLANVSKGTKLFAVTWASCMLRLILNTAMVWSSIVKLIICLQDGSLTHLNERSNSKTLAQIFLLIPLPLVLFLKGSNTFCILH